MKIEVQLSGCVSKQDAKIVSKTVRALKFEARNKTRRQRIGRNQRLQLPEDGREWSFKKNAFNPFEAHNWVLNYYQIGVEIGDAYAAYKIVENLHDEVYYFLRGEKQIGYIVEADLIRPHSVWGLTIRVNALAYRFTSEYVETQIDHFLSHYFHKCIMNRAYFNEHINTDGQVAWAFAKKFFANYFLQGGQHFKKLSVHIDGYVDGVPPSLRWNPTVVPLPGKKRVTVIKDMFQFKRDLIPYENPGGDDGNSSDEE
ncbi:uncharacterized protein LOC118437569 [Folsomia candida]|nr:uncharacterized protein LOC118437569 [Folsomia candida]